MHNCILNTELHSQRKIKCSHDVRPTPPLVYVVGTVLSCEYHKYWLCDLEAMVDDLRRGAEIFLMHLGGKHASWGGLLNMEKSFSSQCPHEKRTKICLQVLRQTDIFIHIDFNNELQTVIIEIRQKFHPQ